MTMGPLFEDIGEEEILSGAGGSSAPTPVTAGNFGGSALWVVITTNALSDAQVDSIHDVGDTDPEWNESPLRGIQLSFLWHCHGEEHEVMNNRWGEAVWN